jgi:hypothetical protein
MQNLYGKIFFVGLRRERIPNLKNSIKHRHCRNESQLVIGVVLPASKKGDMGIHSVNYMKIIHQIYCTMHPSANICVGEGITPTDGSLTCTRIQPSTGS